MPLAWISTHIAKSPTAFFDGKPGCAFFCGQDLPEHAKCALTMEEQGTHSSSELNAAYFTTLKKTLRTSGATVNVGPLTARLDFYDAGIDPHAIPAARQITRTRASLNFNARVEAPGEPPAALFLF